MSKFVTKFKYLKPGGKKKRGGYAKYIGTRDGVEVIDDTHKAAPVSLKQKEFISKLIEDYPECLEMIEYEDFKGNPTMGNASEFISRAIEENADSLSDSKTYADYIATRPRAQRFGSHGLFSDEGDPVILSKVSKELNEYEGNVWTVILSLRREDAERLGFDHCERWRDLLRAHAQELSDQFHIPMENLRWYAAFHNESHHPHCHLMVFSADPKEGYLSKQGFHSLRESLIKEIFAQDLLNEYSAQTEIRDSLRSYSRDTVAEIVSKINTGAYYNPVLEALLLSLAKKLEKHSGKKVYGYLPAETKEIVDAIVNELEKDERIAALYDQWYLRKENIIRTYTRDLPARVALRDNTEFKPIKNAIIQEAMNLGLDRFVIEDGGEDEPNEDTTAIDSDTDAEEIEPPKCSPELQRLIRQAQAGNKWAQYALAKRLLDKDSEEHDPKSAVEWLTKSAEQGYTVAKYKLGKMFLHGDQVQKNVTYALRWLEDAVRDNNPYAEYLLGKCFLLGSELDQDILRGEELLRKAIQQGNRFAEYTLGKVLLDGKLVLQDIPEAIKLLTASADQGFPTAQYVIGKLLYQGELLPRDILAALDRLEAAAAQKNPYAAYLAAKIRLVEGEYKEMECVIRNLEIAAEGGNDYAEYQLGKLYLYGKEVDQDIEKAIDYLTNAAEHGNQYAAQLLVSMQNNRNWSATLGALRLVQAVSRIFQQRMEDERKSGGAHVDRKLNRKIEEKKQAQGLKSG